MKLPLPPRPRRSDIDMVPMINFAFLLLIFFMLAGTLAPAQKLPVHPPDSVTAAAADPSGDVLVFAADGRTAFAEGIVPRAELPARIRRWLQQHPHQTLRVKADAAADAAEVIGVLQLLRAAGVEHISLLTERGTT